MRANLLRASILLATVPLVAGCDLPDFSALTVPDDFWEINWPDAPTFTFRIVVDGLSPTATTGGDVQIWVLYPPIDPDFEPQWIPVPQTGVLELTRYTANAVTYRPPLDHVFAPDEVDTKEIDLSVRGASGMPEVRFVVVSADP
jgi:hypothetical protein